MSFKSVHAHPMIGWILTVERNDVGEKFVTIAGTGQKKIETGC